MVKICIIVMSLNDLDKGETRAESITYLSICPYINKPSMLVHLNKIVSLQSYIILSQ